MQAALPRPTIRMLLAAADRALSNGPHAGKARRDAEELVLLALRRDVPRATRAWLIAHQDDAVAPDVEPALRALLARRSAGEPMQYIAGEAEFYGMPFLVDRSALIPRPETEHVVEMAVALGKALGRPRIVDVGTGSGAIAITLARQLPNAVVTATEVSKAALEVAQRNAERLGFAERVRFLHGDLLAPVAGEHFDIVVSNPPYVPERDRASLAVEVREFEPAQALFAGQDGLEIYRRLIPAAFAALAPGGFVVLEIGFGQRDAVGALFEEPGFAEVEFTDDLQGIPRVASAKRR